MGWSDSSFSSNKEKANKNVNMCFVASEDEVYNSQSYNKLFNDFNELLFSTSKEEEFKNEVITKITNSKW